MSTFIHLSDPHFGTETPAVMAALSSEVKKIGPRAILLTGDITQRARRRQFRAARRFFDKLGVPMLTIPGNHDIPLFNLLERIITPYKNYELFFPKREPLLFTENILFLGLDATSPFRHTRGKLQTGRVERAVEKARQGVEPDTLIGLCIHQPLLIYTKEEQKNLLIGATEFVKLLASLKVDLVLSGHIHLPLITSTAEQDPGLPWHFVFSGAGTCLSRRVRAGVPNSFAEITLKMESGERMEVRQHDFDAASNGFSVVRAFKFQRGERGWSTVAD